MTNPNEIGDEIYNGVARLMNEQTSHYKDFMAAGEELTEEEKTARILEIVKDNLPVLWPLFLVASAK